MSPKSFLSFTVLLLLPVLSFSQFSGQNELSAKISDTRGGRLADFDNDGDHDLVISSYSRDRLFYYENVAGTFIFGVTITSTLDGASLLAVSDINGDGNVDVIAASSDELVWFESNGNGTFSEEVIIDGDVGPVNDIYPADVDGDGDYDLLTSEWYQLYYYENLGDGDFAAEHAFFDEPESSRSVCALDLDEDGDLDVIGTTQSDEVSYYENLGVDGFAEFDLLFEVPNVSRLRLADLDGDGDDDLLVASIAKVLWCENMGDGTLSDSILITEAVFGASKLKIIDSDLDGDLDVFMTVGGDDGKIVQLENLGGATFASPVDISLDVPDNLFLTMADIDGDGYPGIVTNKVEFFEYEIVALENTLGTFSTPTLAIPLTNNLRKMAIGDVNADDIDDILVAGVLDDYFAYFPGNEESGFDPIQTFTNEMANNTAMDIGDLNGDGLNDIVYYDGDVLWCEALGGGDFGSPVLADGNYNLCSKIIARDIDEDGDTDLLVSYDDSKNLVVHVNNGVGLFTSITTISEVTPNPRTFTMADINGDGYDDAVIPSSTDNNISWFENQGDGTFGDQQIITDDFFGAIAISAGDINEDGTIDVTAINFLGELSWFPNDGTGVFGDEASIIVDDVAGRDVYVVDVDDDYDMDIIASYSDGDDYENKIVWYENWGAGILAEEQTISDDIEGISQIVIHDIGTDGDPDIGAISNEEGKTLWFENFGNSNTQVRGELYLDLNEDGDRDTLEPGALFTEVLSTPEHSFSYTYADGRYFLNFDEDVEETYLVAPEDLDYWIVTSDSLNYTVIVDDTFTGKDSLDFGIYPDTLVDRLNADLTGGFPRCNSIVAYWINIQNTGSTIPSGIIHLELHDSLTYVSSEIVPDSIIDQHVYWSYDSLAYFESNNFLVSVEMPDFLSMGITLTSVLTETVDSLGATVFSTSDTLEQILVCAYDPNDKIATPAGTDSLGYIPIDTQDLEYTIRFQNTGTDTAITVVIKDHLDPNLDWASFSPISSSHDMTIDIDYTGQILFTFENIMLPDSNVNEIASHGFVKYKIDLLDDLPSGTQIDNTAWIYFDANPAIVTNTKINTLYDCANILESLSYESTLCYGDSLHADITFAPTGTELVWEIDGEVVSTINSLIWTAEETGEFLLTVQANTDFCSSDSVITIEFLPEIPTLVIDSVFICEGDSTVIFESYQTDPGWYYDSLVSVNGCDSTIALFAELAFPFAESNTYTICDSDSILIFGEYRIEAGIYEDIHSTIAGCDSVFTAYLEVLPTYNETFEPISICEGDSVLIFDSYRTESGVYYDSLSTILGCDSVQMQNLIVHETHLEITANELICEGDSALIFGLYQSEPGLYMDSLLTIHGCDSILQKELISYPLPTVIFAEMVDETICKDFGLLNLEGTPLGGTFSGPGVSGSNFDPSTAGEGTHTLYYTYEDDNGCSATDSVNISVVDCIGINEQNGNQILIYPNPFDDFTVLNFGKDLIENHTVVIHNALGQEVYRNENVTGNSLEIKKSELGVGVYILSVLNYDAEVLFNTKLIVE